jgi:O-antigen/teichoic acid export membrane protein
MMNISPRPIAKSSSALLISQLSLAMMNFVITAYLLRLFSKPEVAVTAVIDILTAIFSFSTLGLLTVATQKGPAALTSGNDQAFAFSLVKCALLYQTIVLIVFGSLTFIFAPQVSQLFLKTSDYTWAIKLLVPGVIASVLFTSLQGVAQIKDDFYMVALWGFIAGILRPLLSIPAYWWVGFNGYLVGVVISFFIPVIGMGWGLRLFFLNDTAPAPFWSTFRYGLPFYLRNFLRFGYLQFDQAIVAIMLSPVALASYSAAHRFRKHIVIVTDAFQAPIGIRMNALNQEEEEVQASFFRKSTRYTTLLIIPITLLVAVASPWLMRIFAGAKYAADWPLLTIMSLAQAGYALYVVYGNAVFARFRPWATLLIDGVNGGLNYLIAPLLVLVLAQYGVAFSQVLGFAAGILCASFLLHRLPGYRYDWKTVREMWLPMLLACVIVGLGELLYLKWWSVPIYISIAVLVFALLVSRHFSAEDWSQFRVLIPTPFLPAWLRIEGLFQRFAVSKPQEL